MLEEIIRFYVLSERNRLLEPLLQNKSKCSKRLFFCLCLNVLANFCSHFSEETILSLLIIKLFLSFVTH